MAGEKEQTIIIKKIIGGAHSAHGGAWKVAFADFMTAMMAFFLVMWLMGADEETKQAVAHYFNHPNTPYTAGRDPQSEAFNPMGEKNGAGDGMTKGAEGAIPDDLVKDPVRNVRDNIQEEKKISEKLKDTLGENSIFGIDVNMEYLKFSVPESDLFDEGDTKLKPTAAKPLNNVGEILSTYQGWITIDGHVDPTAKDNASGLSPFEVTMARAVAVMNFLVKNNWVAESRIQPVGSGGRHPFSTAEHDPDTGLKNRRIEFILSRKKP